MSNKRLPTWRRTAKETALGGSRWKVEAGRKGPTSKVSLWHQNQEVEV